MNELIRCKVCRKPINKDQQRNFYSLCYDCFRRFKKSKMNKAFAMKLIGFIALLYILMSILIFIPGLRFGRPLMIISFIIGVIIAVMISLLLIYFGIMKKRKWKFNSREKPIIERQELITTTSSSEDLTHIKFCPECGTNIVKNGQKFCVNCGTEI